MCVKLILAIFLTYLVTPSECGEKSECSKTDCHSWMSFSDSDPHVSVRLKGQSLHRPVCFDIQGKAGDFVSLYEIGNPVKLKIIGKVFSVSHKARGKNFTYFGSIGFHVVKSSSLQGLNFSIDSRNINVPCTNAETMQQSSFPISWTDEVEPKSLLSDYRGSKSIISKCVGESMLRVEFNHTTFFIVRHTNHLNKSRRSRRRVNYLGIYAQPGENQLQESYDGIIGQFVGKEAEYRNLGPHVGDNVIEFNGREIKVVDYRTEDLLNRRKFHCWFVPNQGKSLLNRQLSSYLRDSIYG